MCEYGPTTQVAAAYFMLKLERIHVAAAHSMFEFMLCCSTRSGMQPTAMCEGHVLEGCGSIAADLYGPLLTTLGALQAQSRKNRKDGEKGLQHTPAFMLAVIADALSGCEGSECDKRTFARGGYSDVGQHTGSVHRGTCWPLLRETIKVWFACAIHAG